MKRTYLILLIIAVLIVPLLSAIRYIWYVAVNPKRAVRVLVGYDQLANVALGGDEDETISSRAGRHMKDEKWACWLCKFLDNFQKDHCKKSIGS